MDAGSGAGTNGNRSSVISGGGQRECQYVWVILSKLKQCGCTPLWRAKVKGRLVEGGWVVFRVKALSSPLPARLSTLPACSRSNRLALTCPFSTHPRPS